MKEVIVSAPGKILWTGGYSILEKGNIGLVSSVDKRVYARCSELEPMNVHIKSPQLGVDVTGVFEEGKLKLSQDHPNAKFVKTAIETTLTYLKAKRKRLKGVDIDTYSDPAFGFGETKSGLGSSAAVTVATIGAVLALHGVRPRKNLHLVHKLAQYAHSTSQGKVGSGFDVAASVFGGHEYSRYSPTIVQELDIVKAVDRDWDYSAIPLALPFGFAAVVANIPGTSVSTTEMVAKVKAFKEGNKSEYNAIINHINEAAKEANQALAQLATEPTNEAEVEKFVQHFEASRKATRELGEKSGAPIEPSRLSQIIEESKQHGALVARLPGAGGGDSIVAICRNKKDVSKLKKFWAKKKLEVLKLKITGKGIALERKLPISGS